GDGVVRAAVPVAVVVAEVAEEIDVERERDAELAVHREGEVAGRDDAGGRADLRRLLADGRREGGDEPLALPAHELDVERAGPHHVAIESPLFVAGGLAHMVTSICGRYAEQEHTDICLTEDRSRAPFSSTDGSIRRLTARVYRSDL